MSGAQASLLRLYARIRGSVTQREILQSMGRCMRSLSSLASSWVETPRHKPPAPRSAPPGSLVKHAFRDALVRADDARDEPRDGRDARGGRNPRPPPTPLAARRFVNIWRCDDDSARPARRESRLRATRAEVSPDARPGETSTKHRRRKKNRSTPAPPVPRRTVSPGRPRGVASETPSPRSPRARVRVHRRGARAGVRRPLPRLFSPRRPFVRVHSRGVRPDDSHRRSQFHRRR